MLQLNPAEYMGIVRQLSDGGTLGTVYVQAKIRNARTDALIDTVNLTDRGSGRFSNEWLVYAQSGDPLYISITTTVYDDAAYTSASANYEIESETYLIDPRAKHFGGGGGGITESMARRIMREVLADWQPRKVEMPPPVKSITAGQVRKVLREELAGIDVKPNVQIDAPDLSPLMEAIRAIDFQPQITVDDGGAGMNAVETTKEHIRALLGEFADAISQAFDSKMEEMGKSFKASDAKVALMDVLSKHFSNAITEVNGIKEEVAQAQDNTPDWAKQPAHELIKRIVNGEKL